MTWMLLLCVLALAQEPVDRPEDIRREVAADVYVNWTKLTLEVSADARSGGVENTRAVEELARRDADAGLRLGVARVQVRGDRQVADLQKVPEFGAAIQDRVSRWRASKTHYFSSGRVLVSAELSLQDLLKPYTLATAHQEGENERPQPRYSGVVIDARGYAVEPAWSPRVLGSNGELLYDGTVREDRAINTSPVIYVPDPAHPASARAGGDPIFLSCSSADGTDLVLTADDSQRFRTSLNGARLLGEGKVVVVVDR